MGMMVGGIRSNTRMMQIKRSAGSAAASFRISKPSQKKTKRLSYNFKSVSTQIMLSKSSNAAGKAVTKARGVLTSLLRKAQTGEYDDQELEHAIIHARKMERVAKKRQKHLRQEEEIKQKGNTQEREEELVNKEEESRKQNEQQLEMSEEEIQKLMEEYEKLIEEAMRDAMRQMQEEMQFDELSEDMDEAVHDMKPEDFDRLKKKHRSDEMREMMDADMKYLRAVFNKLQREKEALSSGSPYQNQGQMDSGVSLEMYGFDMPAEMPEMPVMAEGGSVDIML